LKSESGGQGGVREALSDAVTALQVDPQQLVVLANSLVGINFT
jgi:hypothetical protein